MEYEIRIPLSTVVLILLGFLLWYDSYDNEPWHISDAWHHMLKYLHFLVRYKFNYYRHYKSYIIKLYPLWLVYTVVGNSTYKLY